MRTTWTTIVGGACGTAAALVWAVSLAVYQPFMQPRGVQAVAENNTYWPRDIRQLAILLAIASVVLIAGAGSRVLLVAGGSAIAWLAADLWLDRVDAAGWLTALWLAVAAAAWFGATALAAVRLGAGEKRGELAGYLVAATAAVLAAFTTVVTTPWDEPVTQPDRVRVEDALTVLKWTLVVSFALAAIALIAHRLTARRAGVLAAFGALAAVVAVPAAYGYGPLSALGLFAMPVLAALAVAASRDAPTRRLIGTAFPGFVAVLTVLLPLRFISTGIGAALTSLAHNPPVNSADSDAPLALVGLVIGVMLALVTYAATRPADNRRYVTVENSTVASESAR